jgi:hypothetical protein
MNLSTENTMRTLEQLIADHPFWKGLNPDYFRLLNEGASEMRFGVQQQIFQEESDADHFYLTRRAIQTRRDVSSEREGCVKLTPEVPASLENFALLFMRLLRPFGKGWCRLEQQSGIREECRIEPSKRLVFSSDGG